MKPAAFAYAKARSLDHAIALLGEHEGARVLAGGQSLIATLNMRLDAPSLLVDINGIAGLDGIARRNGRVEIGALVRHASAERSPIIAEHVPLIAQAMPHIGHPAIRNRGTIGGSIAFADPAAELPACLLALGGEVEIAGPQGQPHRHGRRFLQRPVRDRARAATTCSPRIRVPAATADTPRRLCRIRPPPRRLRAWSGSPPRAKAAGKRLARRAARVFRRRRDAGARARRRKPRLAGGERRRRGRGARARSRSARRPAGDRRGQEASRRRAAAARRRELTEAGA